MSSEFKSTSKIFQGQLGAYEVIVTEDESLTLKSGFFDEACHSLSGAKAETRHNYLKNGLFYSKSYKEKKPKLTVLEVGFGLGHGYLETSKALGDAIELHFISLELDPSLVSFAQELSSPVFHELKESAWGFDAQIGPHQLSLILGDARKTITTLKGFFPGLMVDAIYLDAFSPRRNPALWTSEFLSELWTLGQKGSVLTTYSASQSVRKTLDHVGFAVESFPGFGRKKQCTRAWWEGESLTEIIKMRMNSNIPLLND